MNQLKRRFSTLRKISIEANYTIGIAAKMVGVSVQLLRVYEQEDLIIPVKTETGRRLYSDLEVEKVKCIRNMINETGINFEGIRRLLALMPCWRIRECTNEEKHSCKAQHSADKPCWATEEKCAHPLSSCRDCEVYQQTVDCQAFKKIIFDM